MFFMKRYEKVYMNENFSKAEAQSLPRRVSSGAGSSRGAAASAAPVLTRASLQHHAVSDEASRRCVCPEKQRSFVYLCWFIIDSE